MTQTTQDRVHGSTREATHFSSCAFHLGIVKEFTMKKCSRCGETKPKTEFNKNCNTKDGLRYQCKACSTLSTTESRLRAKGANVSYKPSKKGRPVSEDPNLRWCSTCKAFLPLSSFGKNLSRKDTVQFNCKACTNITNKTNKRYTASTHYRNMATMHTVYGITETEYQDIMNTQKGCCAICKRDFGTLRKRANIDHDHETGEVRGLLCWSCNTLLGAAKDKPTILINAVAYLEQWEYA